MRLVVQTSPMPDAGSLVGSGRHGGGVTNGGMHDHCMLSHMQSRFWSLGHKAYSARYDMSACSGAPAPTPHLLLFSVDSLRPPLLAAGGGRGSGPLPPLGAEAVMGRGSGFVSEAETMGASGRKEGMVRRSSGGADGSRDCAGTAL